MHERRFDPSQVDKLENPARRQYLPPAEVVAALKLEPGWQVADIGAGTGYFALSLAEAVGGVGRVFAVDVEPKLLGHIREKLAAAGVENVELIHGEASQTGLASGSCDCVFYANDWHEFDDHAAVLKEALRLLKPQGKIAILDWRDDVESVQGPPLHHRIPLATVRQELIAAGLVPEGEPWIGKYSWLTVGARE